MQLKPLFLIPLFLTLLFLLNYYEWKYLLAPTQAESLSFYQFFTFNFLLWTIIHLAKFVLLSIIIYAVSLLFTIESSGAARFKEIVGLVVLLEFVFLFQKIYKIIYLEVVNNNYSRYEVINFSPPFLQMGMPGNFLHAFFTELNLFTLVYLICMLIGFKTIFSIQLKKASLLVALSYLLPLALFVAIRPW